MPSVAAGQAADPESPEQHRVDQQVGIQPVRGAERAGVPGQVVHPGPRVHPEQFADLGGAGPHLGLHLGELDDVRFIRPQVGGVLVDAHPVGPGGQVGDDLRGPRRRRRLIPPPRGDGHRAEQGDLRPACWCRPASRPGRRPDRCPLPRPVPGPARAPPAPGSAGPPPWSPSARGRSAPAAAAPTPPLPRRAPPPVRRRRRPRRGSVGLIGHRAGNGGAGGEGQQLSQVRGLFGGDLLGDQLQAQLRDRQHTGVVDPELPPAPCPVVVSSVGVWSAVVIDHRDGGPAGVGR